MYSTWAIFHGIRSSNYCKVKTNAKYYSCTSTWFQSTKDKHIYPGYCKLDLIVYCTYIYLFLYTIYFAQLVSACYIHTIKLGVRQ